MLTCSKNVFIARSPKNSAGQQTAKPHPDPSGLFKRGTNAPNDWMGFQGILRECVKLRSPRKIHWFLPRSESLRVTLIFETPPHISGILTIPCFGHIPKLAKMNLTVSFNDKANHDDIDDYLISPKKSKQKSISNLSFFGT